MIHKELHISNCTYPMATIEATSHHRRCQSSREELWGPIASGRNDFLWRSVVHFSGNSLLLKVLLCLTSMLWSGWEMSKMSCSFDSILFSDTAIRESSSTPTTSLALRISLLSLLASGTLSLLPQHATAKRIALATTDL